MPRKKVELTPYSKGKHGRPIDRGARAGRAGRIGAAAMLKRLRTSTRKSQVADEGAFE